jgi:gliding motility-associated-like protein
MLGQAAANGTADADFINFNIMDQSELGRTIVLLSLLPAVSSNLTIDASSQPGSVFGLSTAKIKLVTSFTYPSAVYGLLMDNVQQVNVYGLYIKNTIPYPNNQNSNLLQGIAIRDCRDIQIGAAARGNVIVGFEQDIGLNVHLTGGQIHYHSVGLVIRANFIGIEPDGSTLSTTSSKPLQINYVNGVIAIGGAPAEGNILPKGIRINQTNAYDYTGDNVEMFNMPATITFRNNKVGVDYTESIPFVGAVGFSLGVHQPGGKNTVFIEDNIISGNSSYGIQLNNNKDQVIVRRNYIGVDRSLTKQLPIGGTGIFIYGCDKVQIGGDDPADKNYIAYCKPINVWPSSSVSVNKNSFFCVVDQYPMIFASWQTRPFPVISITNVTAASVTGTATPNASVELFYADRCGTCAPETYFGSASTDVLGNWHYDGLISGSVIASATHNGATSEFSRPLIDASGIKIVHTCSNTGAIKGVVPSGASVINWLDENGTVVGTAADLENVPPGKYKLKIVNGDCNTETGYYEIKQAVALNAAGINVKNAICGGSNGWIRGIQVTNNTTGPLKYSWKDAGGNEVGTSLELNNIKAGNYTLSIIATDNVCTLSYGPVLLSNSAGPNINEANFQMVSSECGKALGKITGITVTGQGTISYKWTNAVGQQVASTLDLLDQPAGIYTLQVSDASGCGAITSSAISISETNAVLMDDTGIVKPATCGKSNGAITGITVSGATNYQWFKQTGELQATTSTASLIDVAAGDYYLVATNSSCNKVSKIYSVGDIENTTDYGQPLPQLSNASCGRNNGSIGFSFVKAIPAGYRWVNKDNGQRVGDDSPILNNLDAGTYQLYLANADKCERLFGEFNIERVPELTLNDDNAKIGDDHCNLSAGSITGITVSGKMPFSYKWENELGATIGIQKDLHKVAAGTYTLSVSDASGCLKTISLTLSNKEQVLPMPEINDIQLCSGGDAIMIVSNVLSSYSYRLYEDESSPVWTDEQTSGRFKISVKGDRSFYISQFSGTCESARKKVNIKVGYTGLTIPNAFSPNNDGFNDTWRIQGMDKYPKASVVVFNRYGSKVFESTKYQTAFDGNKDGTILPSGVYYYMIKIGEDCKAISGSLTLLR